MARGVTAGAGLSQRTLEETLLGREDRERGNMGSEREGPGGTAHSQGEGELG